MTINDMPAGKASFAEGPILHEKSADTLPHETSRHIVMSPYVEQEHLLDLETLDVENQILAEALADMQCLREDYATAPYLETFNWGEVMDRVKELTTIRKHDWRETTFYIVAFRSRYVPGIDYSHLGDLDKAAHAEATASGGFLKYWFGTPNQDLRNLATCIWRTREDAKKGGVGPAHKEAVKAVRTMYAEWRIDQHQLVIRDGVSSWEITDWNS
ncbi:hypothetical protein VMCG_08603 [Cytospora schulzeri]|uniref:Uncharacterized protein n=1 Tax=Cytospora schulzeri TaxID=448051 RepID=A0A423VVU9_9PEZI|nr:hypothetical protein VMCG_08603 [Valsa malicola]